MLDNPKWEKFCQAYAQDGNAAAAYRAAGYTAKNTASASAAAVRLLNNVKVQERIQELTEEARMIAEKSAIADIREIRETMTAILRGEIDDTKPADRIRAGDFLAKTGGMMPQEAVKVELSLSGKLARLRELLEDDDD